LNGANVKTILQGFQQILLGIHDHDVVGFAGEAGEYAAADLAGAEDDDFHAGDISGNDGYGGSVWRGGGSPRK
jgi:hypothetical protein